MAFHSPSSSELFETRHWSPPDIQLHADHGASSPHLYPCTPLICKYSEASKLENKRPFPPVRQVGTENHFNRKLPATPKHPMCFVERPHLSAHTGTYICHAHGKKYPISISLYLEGHGMAVETAGERIELADRREQPGMEAFCVGRA